MEARIIKIAGETGARKVFVWALEWPGWCRSGRDLDSAHQALLAAAPRYALVVAGAGFDFPVVAGAEFETVTLSETTKDDGDQRVQL